MGLKAGGCSGYEYTFAWEATPRSDDQVFDGPEGARVFVDPRSFRLIDGTVLDYDTNLVSKGFMFNNPNAKSTCGCGSEFQRMTTSTETIEQLATREYRYGFVTDIEADTIPPGLNEDVDSRASRPRSTSRSGCSSSG